MFGFSGYSTQIHYAKLLKKAYRKADRAMNNAKCYMSKGERGRADQLKSTMRRYNRLATYIAFRMEMMERKETLS